MSSSRFGILQSEERSPLPQEELHPNVISARIADAFFQFLPNNSTIFFQRVYFAAYPRPVQGGGLPGFPRTVPVARIQAPAQQSIVLKHSFFRVYEHTGIDVDDVMEVDPSRTTTVFGFQTSVGNRGLTDYNTNLTARGDIIAFNPGKAGGTTIAPQPGQGSFYPFAGGSQAGLDNFAYYARPRQTIDANVIILRPPPFDTRLFSVELTGLVLPEVTLSTILERLSG